MRMTLDFSAARITACHEYEGVVATINGHRRVVTVTADGCRFGQPAKDGIACGRPVLDHVQAWSVAMLVTGAEATEPRDGGEWDEVARTLTFVVGRTRRRMLA